MKTAYNRPLSLFTALFALLWLPMLSSCGKEGNINPNEAKIQYQVLNLSYDVLPVNLYVNLLRQNATPFRYPSASGYFGLTTIDTPFQIRSTTTATVTNLLKIDSTRLSRDTRYSLYIVGSRQNNTLSYIFTVDTSTTPRVGRGKVRFINTCMPVSGAANGLSLTANDTVAFSAVTYKQVRDYIEIPAGMYNFAVRPAGNNTQVLATLRNTTIQDGRLYTIYTYGIPFRTDTTAFGTAILTNR